MTSDRRTLLKTAVLGATATLAPGCSREKLARCTPLNAISDVDNTEINIDTIRQAEKLQSISYTDEERLQVLVEAEDRLSRIASLRQHSFTQNALPSHTFNPKLPNSGIRSQKNTFSFSAYSKKTPPTSDHDIVFADLKTQGELIRSGALSSIQLTEMYLNRIDQHDPTLRAFITVTADQARKQARKADSELGIGRDRGPLHGLPFGLKDIVDTKNIPTTWGAKPNMDRVPKKDAEIVRKLKRAGAVMLGKTSCGALAYGDEWFGGLTRNPWNIDEGASGSSAGSSAAVAAGLCSFSIGSETLGSIISPSERCGCVGLRPTFGRISRAGVMSLAWSLDKIGPMARGVEDAAAVLSALNGYDADDPSTARMGFSYDAKTDLKALRIGYVPEWFERGDQTDRSVLKLLKDLGCQVSRFPWPKGNFDSLIEILHVEAAANFAEYTLSNTDDDLNSQLNHSWPNKWRSARFVSAVDYLQIDRLRRSLMIQLSDAFKSFDVLIGPHYAGDALLATNCAGYPQMCVPVGFAQTPSRNLFNQPLNGAVTETFQTPRGISLWGGLFQEGPMIALAAALQRTTTIWGSTPPGF
ncbi:MAG: amidase [Pseudomonadota bacterium]